MKNQCIIINDNDILYDILEEISDELNFSVIKFLKKDFALKKSFSDLNYLFLTNKEISNIKNQILIDKFPLNVFKLVEKLNIEFLKLKFNEQSDIKISNYRFNVNSKEMKNDDSNLNIAAEP